MLYFVYFSIIAIVAGGCKTPNTNPVLSDPNQQTNVTSEDTPLTNVPVSIKGATSVEVETTSPAIEPGASGENQVGPTQEKPSIEITVERLAGDIDRLYESVRRGEILGEEESSDYMSVRKRVDDLESRIKILESALANLGKPLPKEDTPAKENVNLKWLAVDLSKDTNADVSRLADLYNSGRYEEVIAIVPKIIREAKENVKIDLQYLYAESLYGAGDHRLSALTFNEIQDVKKYGPRTTLRLGQCFELLGDKATAVLFYADVLEKFPTSEEADEAHLKSHSKK